MLCYCTNVHPSETWEQLNQALGVHAASVRRELGEPTLGVGIYISNAVSELLTNQREKMEAFKDLLSVHSLKCQTFNGYPYGNFHAQRVKEAVYEPNWRDPRRLAYTLRLGWILAGLIAEGERASISTLAGGYKLFRSTPDERNAFVEQLALVAIEFDRIAQEQGREIALALEPEPYTTIESAADAVDFFRNHLWQRGLEIVVRETGLTRNVALEVLRRHIGLCVDICHQAVQFESSAEFIVQTWRGCGIRIPKIQLSNALEIRDAKGLGLLAEFAEPRYLHQTYVRQRDANGAISISRYPDLPMALDELARRPQFEAVRTHMHVPLFWDEMGSARATVADLRYGVEAARQLGATDTWEIETYTWDIIPELVEVGGPIKGIAREFRWVRETLNL